MLGELFIQQVLIYFVMIMDVFGWLLTISTDSLDLSLVDY